MSQICMPLVDDAVLLTNVPLIVNLLVLEVHLMQNSPQGSMLSFEQSLLLPS